MKAFRSALLFLLAVVVGTTSAFAQDAQTKNKIAEIRTAYTNAVKLAQEGKNGAKKNYQVYESVATDPNGVWNRKVEFIYDNSEIFKELEIYPCELVMIRQTIGTSYQEFLFDPNGELIFVFVQNKSPESKSYDEYRYYYSVDGPFWKIEKTIESKTNKVISTDEGPTNFEGDAIWYHRVAGDLKSAFEYLNVIYD